jgi:hypothetical protein
VDEGVHWFAAVGPQLTDLQREAGGHNTQVWEAASARLRDEQQALSRPH